MRRCHLWILLLAAAAAWGRQDIFFGREWEPDFRVQRGSLLRERPDATPAEQQVFTCILSLQDLQLRRCDSPDAAPPADSLAADSLAAGGLPGRAGCYRAEYEISLEIFSGKGRHRKSAASRYHYDAFTLESSHPEGLDPRRWVHFEVDLPPGRYSWWVEFQDLQSRRHVRREGRFRVVDLSREQAALSGLWLLAEVDSLAPDPLKSRPFIEERGGAHPPELIVYYEVWSREAASLGLQSLILDRRERERHRRVLNRAFPAGITRNLLRVPLHDLGSGDYLLELSLGDAADSSGRPDRVKGRSARARWQPGDLDEDAGTAGLRLGRFTVRWRGEPGSPSDLDRAVEQLRYILPPRRFKELQEAPMSRRKELFDEFWASVDPSPGSEANELMAEYYRRAEFADRRFSWSRFAGWRSDRGRVYMIHGDPDQVERQDAGLDSPAWELWSYEESGREFYFIDRAGFGDYQLVINPED